MEEIEVEIAVRTEQGSAKAGRLRRAGKVPMNISTPGGQSILCSMESLEYSRKMHRRAHAQLFRFKSADSSLNGKLGLVKETQRDAVSGNVLHIDMLNVDESHRLRVQIPVNITGSSVLVQQSRITISQTTYEVEIECFPAVIPSSLSIDITNIGEGKSLHASDIVMPSGVLLITEPNTVIVVGESKSAAEAAATAAATPAAAA